MLAVVTAVVDAGGGSRVTTPAATLAAYRPALLVIPGVAVLGAVVALAGLRRGADAVPASAETAVALLSD